MDADDRQALEALFASMRSTVETMSKLIENLHQRLTKLENHRDVAMITDSDAHVADIGI